MPRTNVAIPSPAATWWNFSSSTATPRSYNMAVRAAMGPLAAAVEVLMRSPTAMVAR